jgi:hypothetical protein
VRVFAPEVCSVCKTFLIGSSTAWSLHFRCRRLYSQKEISFTVRVALAFAIVPPSCAMIAFEHISFPQLPTCKPHTNCLTLVPLQDSVDALLQGRSPVVQVRERQGTAGAHVDIRDMRYDLTLPAQGPAAGRSAYDDDFDQALQRVSGLAGCMVW